MHCKSCLHIKTELTNSSRQICHCEAGHSQPRQSPDAMSPFREIASVTMFLRNDNGDTVIARNEMMKQSTGMYTT